MLRKQTDRTGENEVSIRGRILRKSLPTSIQTR